MASFLLYHQQYNLTGLMRIRYLTLFAGLLLAGCDSLVGPGPAPAITGTYQLTQYTTPTASDVNPTGTAIVTATDNDHVAILVKGTSAKTKISYSYTNVSVSGPGPETYTLLYKGRVIGEAGNDGMDRYVTLSPTTTVSLRSVEF